MCSRSPFVRRFGTVEGRVVVVHWAVSKVFPRMHDELCTQPRVTETHHDTPTRSRVLELWGNGGPQLHVERSDSAQRCRRTSECLMAVEDVEEPSLGVCLKCMQC